MAPLNLKSLLEIMTMPHLMNCSHQDSGWCLACVNEMHQKLESLEKDQERLKKCVELLAPFLETTVLSLIEIQKETGDPELLSLLKRFAKVLSLPPEEPPVYFDGQSTPV